MKNMKLINTSGEVTMSRAFIFLEDLTDLNLIECSEEELKMICRCVKIGNLDLDGDDLRALREWATK